MQKVRILLAIEPLILCDLVAEWFRGEPDLQVVGTSQHPVETLLAVRRTEADVVVTVTENDEVPPVCGHLFNEFPALAVIAISNDATRATLYRQQVCQTPVPLHASHELLTSMRQLLAQEAETASPVAASLN